jgi:hypothetical protein
VKNLLSLYCDFIQAPLDALLTVGYGRRTAGMHEVDDLPSEFIIGRQQPFVESMSGRMSDSMDIVKELHFVNIQMDRYH